MRASMLLVIGRDIYLLPQALGAALFMPVDGRLFDRLGARPTVIAGLVLVTISTWFLAQVTALTAGADLGWVLGLRGAGMGLMMMPLNTHLLNSAPRALVSRVTALTGALQNVVGSLAIASLATILQSRATTHVAAARTAITRYQHTVIAHAAARSAHHAGAVPPLKGTGHVAPSHAVIVAFQHYATAAIHTALAAAFDDTFLVATVLAAIGVVLAFTLRRQGGPPTTTAEPAWEQGGSRWRHSATAGRSAGPRGPAGRRWR